MKDNLEVNKQKLGIDSWLKLIEEDKNLNGAYISISQYIWLLEKELEKLNNINKKYERLNKKNNIGFKITNVQEYNIDELLSCKKYKDNWNYIKKMLKEVRQEKFNIAGYCGTCTDVDIDFLLNKMHELEQGSRK